MDDTPTYDEEAEALNELVCTKCGQLLKIIGRSGFCKNKKCTIYEVLFKQKPDVDDVEKTDASLGAEYWKKGL